MAGDFGQSAESVEILRGILQAVQATERGLAEFNKSSYGMSPEPPATPLGFADGVPDEGLQLMGQGPPSASPNQYPGGVNLPREASSNPAARSYGASGGGGDGLLKNALDSFGSGEGGGVEGGVAGAF